MAEMPLMPRGRLHGFERIAVPLLAGLNRRTRLKTLIQAVVGNFEVTWITLLTHRLWRPYDAHHVVDLDAPRGVILVANHRSFFDMYICLSLLIRRSRWIRRLFFPVRKDFFYDRPLGVVLNVGISGGSMWPPVFRDERGKNLNPIGLEQLAAVLQRGTVVGIHPEGRRGQGDDPYELLPTKPGLGRLVLACDPQTVIAPVFIAGLSNNVRTLLTRQFRPVGQRGEPIRMWFGEPFTAGELQRDDDARAITDTVMNRITELGERDRQARASDSRPL